MLGVSLKDTEDIPVPCFPSPEPLDQPMRDSSLKPNFSVSLAQRVFLGSEEIRCFSFLPESPILQEKNAIQL